MLTQYDLGFGAGYRQALIDIAVELTIICISLTAGMHVAAWLVHKLAR